MARALRAGDTRTFRFSVHTEAEFEVQSRATGAAGSDDRDDVDSYATRLRLAQAFRRWVNDQSDDDLAYGISDVREVGRS